LLENTVQNNFSSQKAFNEINNYISAIRLNEDKLHLLSNSSEQEFLHIGGKLQDYLISSKQLGEVASKTASSVSDELLNKDISEVSWLLKKFSDFLDNSASEIKADRKDLLTIHQRVSVIVDELDGFRSIVKKLRMLGVATKIESARLGTDDNGFNALAENVSGLSTLISDKVEVIKKKSYLLFRQIVKTTEDLAKLELKHKEQSEIIIKNTSLSLSAFEQKYNECFQKVDKISLNTQSVTKSIREIVTAIQFHDITRQQIEHVCEALSETSSQQMTDSTEEAFNSSAAVIHDICELQIIQLRNSLSEFKQAVTNIIESLGSVDENVTEIFDEISDLFNESSANNDSSLKKISEELFTISQSLIKNFEIEKELSSSVISVVGILDELSDYVLQIEDIGTEIEIIALNARVKSARTGENGAALGVLAEAILTLSLDAKRHTNSTTIALSNIVDASKKMKSNLDENEKETTKKEIEASDKKINDVMESLLKMESETSSMISKMKTDVNKLNSEINKTIESISIHKHVDSVIGEVISELSSIAFELKSKADLKTDRVKHTSKLLAKYTMQSERKIHKSFTRDWSYHDEKENKTDPDQDSLGDNVELF